MMKIGLRIPGACSRVDFSEFAAWCKSAEFDSIDLGWADAARGAILQQNELELGTVDLGGTSQLLSSDEAVRKEGIEKGIAAINGIADMGGNKAFCVFFPHDFGQSRTTSFENWKSAFPTVVSEAEKRGVRIAVEGWPGPNNTALGVVPETLRAMFAAVPSDNFGVNYDPSHLIRVGVDYKRFLNEFVSRVIHVHGKDCALDTEGQYLYGNIGTTFDKPADFGEGDWRYTIPGEGDAEWHFICARLNRAGYDGMVSIELEDFRYNGTVEGEKLGLARSRDYLVSLL